METYLSDKEGVNWIETKIWGNGEEKKYFIPRFSRKLDVISIENTKFIPGTNQILRPCFALSKVQAFHLFHGELKHHLWKITPFLYVSETIKKAIQKEKLTGISFEKAFVL